MGSQGIILTGPDEQIEARAEQYKLPVIVDPMMELAFDKQLIVEPGITIPWDLLSAAWHFLKRWDGAVPLWRYGVTAADVGTKKERTRTQKITRDLRVLLYSHELLFLRKNQAGEALRAAFLEEMKEGEEKRLAFLRAYYRVKPKMCVLPLSWMAKTKQRLTKDTRTRARMRADMPRAPLVQVEVAPGVFVRCNEGDEEKVQAKYAHLKGRKKRR